MLRGGCDPVGNPQRNWLVAGVLTCGDEPRLEQVFWQHLWPWGPTLEQSVPGLHPADPTLDQGKTMRRKEQQR